MNHPSNLGPVRQGKGLMEAFEPKPANGFLLVFGSSDCAPDPFDGNRFLHMEPLSSRLLFQTFFQPPLQEVSIG